MIDNKTIRQVVINKALLPCTPGEKVLKEISSQAGETGLNFYTNLDDTMPKFEITITPAQASGTPTPENPLTIEGDNELKISQGAETGSGLSEVYTIPLGQTVYGGVVDVVSGTITTTLSQIDLKSLNGWEQHPTYLDIYRCPSYMFPNIVRPAVNEAQGTLCEKYKSGLGTSALSDMEDGTIVIGRTGVNYIFIRDSGATDLTDFLTNRLGNSCDFVYSLVTPTTSQLTPVEIKTFKKHTNKFRIRSSYATEATYYTMEGGSCDLAKQFLPIFYPSGKD